LKTVKKVFTPLAEVNGSVMFRVGFMQLAILLFAWTFLVPKQSFVPNLIEVVSAWGSMWNDGLFWHIMATLGLCGIATLISIVTSSLIAYATRLPFFKPLGYLITKLRYNPIQGFTLFLALQTGGGRPLQITLLIIFMSFYFVSALISILDDIPEEDIIRRRAERMSEWNILWHVVILDRLDYLIEVIRLNLSMTFMMIVSVEAMDKSQGGLGALMIDTTKGLNFPKVFALELTILVIGIILDEVLKAIYKQFPANKKII
jgi:ABC-type nitrate/sulfonate/bicarbonate transport system permease component